MYEADYSQLYDNMHPYNEVATVRIISHSPNVILNFILVSGFNEPSMASSKKPDPTSIDQLKIDPPSPEDLVSFAKPT